MTTLLDTHALVWLPDGNERLGKKSRTLKGRLTLVQEIGEWLRIAMSMPGVRMAALSVDVSVASTRLPGDFHSDPADRIIVATARQLGATLVTEDKLILDYSKAGHVKTHRAGV